MQYPEGFNIRGNIAEGKNNIYIYRAYTASMAGSLTGCISSPRSSTAISRIFST